MDFSSLLIVNCIRADTSNDTSIHCVHIILHFFAQTDCLVRLNFLLLNLASIFLIISLQLFTLFICTLLLSSLLLCSWLVVDEGGRNSGYWLKRGDRGERRTNYEIDGNLTVLIRRSLFCLSFSRFYFVCLFYKCIGQFLGEIL